MPVDPTGLLLLVEDDEQLCGLLSEVLADEGFHLLVARDGTDAMAMLNEHRRDLHGLITDIDLGSSLDGWSVANAARVLRPDLPVVYMSGASAHHWPSRGVADSVMMEKPFAFSRLTRAIRVALGFAPGI